MAGGAREKRRTVDNIVVTGLEHNANLFPWLQACQRSGAKLRIIPLDKDGAPDITQALQMIDEHTRFVAVSYTHLDVYKRQIIPWAPYNKISSTKSLHS